MACSGQCTKKSLEYSCPWISLHIVLCQKDLSKADLKTTRVLAAWKASPFPEVTEVFGHRLHFPSSECIGWDVCSTYRVLCCCCVAIRRHLKCFFLGVLFKNVFLWSSVLFICLQLSSPFLPVRKQKLSDIRTQQGLSQGGLILIICIMFLSRSPSELGGVLALSKNKSWLTLMYLASNYKKKPSFFSFSEVQRPFCNAPFLYLSEPG